MFASCDIERINSWDWILPPPINPLDKQNICMSTGSSLQKLFCPCPLCLKSFPASETTCVAWPHFCRTSPCGVGQLLSSLGAELAWLTGLGMAGCSQFHSLAWEKKPKNQNNCFKALFFWFSTPLIYQVAAWGDVVKVRVIFSWSVRGLRSPNPVPWEQGRTLSTPWQSDQCGTLVSGCYRIISW